jgi:hypothetical protein
MPAAAGAGLTIGSDGAFRTASSEHQQPVGRIANPPFSFEKEAGYAVGYDPMGCRMAMLGK